MIFLFRPESTGVNGQKIAPVPQSSGSLSTQTAMLKESADATPLNAQGFAVYSSERVRRRLQPQCASGNLA